MSSPREWTWRDSGNHGPLVRSFNILSRGLGYANKRFIPDQLMEKAARKTGLDDFGEPGFREGLELLCRSFSADRQLTGLGQLFGRQMITGTLVNRLQVIDWCKTHPEVEQEVIRQPWVVTGLIRTGTTLCSALFDLDTRVRTPLVWEVDSPIPPPLLTTRHSDPRIAQSARQLAMLNKLAPPMQAIHPMEACYPQECVVLTQLDFHSILFQAVSMAPEYMDWYTSSKKFSAYRLHKKVLQIWQSAIPTIRWGSKAPNHMHGIDALMDTYPDARVVWCHRDPLVCIASVLSLSATFLKPFTRRIDAQQLGEIVSRHWLAGLQNMMAYDQSQTGRRWCHHLYYQDLVSDPVMTMRKAYQHFHDEVDELHERKIRTWVQQRPQGVFGLHKYSLGDFGLDAARLREQYAEYIDRYQVPDE